MSAHVLTSQERWDKGKKAYMFWSTVHSSYFPLMRRVYISGHQECRERHKPDGLLFIGFRHCGAGLWSFHSLALAVLSQIKQW